MTQGDEVREEGGDLEVVGENPVGLVISDMAPI